ncbi:hypothetical protein [Methylomonas albis]|uniref:Uncharacterized protein n=1 Tax=Methylomonas albis TaxID=1854563 RepID=A0ABR9D7M0_9GAMM|nr:hypothetical protein [Methylomonas albis]MBD9358751.1 hypothetical protein [Methylomonas albis]CAD6882204.1 hypothetical protein [Methylomonas albis]
MEFRTGVYQIAMLLAGLIYAWPKSKLSVHPEPTRLTFDTDSQSWLLTLNEELSSGIVVCFLITLVYGFYWLSYQEKFKKTGSDEN